MINKIQIMGWQILELPNIEGAWISAHELSRHLGYTDPNAVSLIYNRHRKSFINKDDSLTIKLKVRGMPCKIRLFSERGALKVVRYSDTVVADKIMDEIFDVFIAYKNGKLVPREVWPLIAHQGKLITLIAQECDKDRKRIESLEKRQNALEEEVSSLKNNEGNFPAIIDVIRQTETISATQAQAIYKLVKEVASSRGQKSRNQTMRTWHEFKKQFGIRRYQELPKKRFDEAMRWLNKKIDGRIDKN